MAASPRDTSQVVVGPSGNTGLVYRRAGTPNWQIKYTGPDGKEVRKSSGTEEKAVAVAQLTELLADLLTFQAASVAFFERKKMSDATRRGYLASLKRWDDYVGHLPCGQITKLHLQQFVKDRQEAGVGSPAIRQDLAFLSSLLTYAQGMPNGPEINVVRHFPKKHLERPEERTRFLTRPEAALLLSKLSGERRRIVKLNLETGMRRSELLRVKCSQVHLAERYILLAAEQTKTSEGRSVPLSAEALSTIEAQLQVVPKGCVWLFPNPETGEPYYDARPWFPKALAEAGIKDFHFHDLRHTFASWWTQDGKSERALSEILGHKTAQMTRRYSHLRVKHLLEEMDRKAQSPHKPE